jgi:hypothetical protein
MSTSDVIVGASLIALGATAASLLMFGNVGATLNNIDSDQAFQLLHSLRLSGSELHSITSGISHLARHLAQNASPVLQQMNHVGQQVVGQVGHAAAPVVQQIGHVGGKVVGQVGHAAAPVVNQIGHVGGQVAGQVGHAAAPIVNEVGQVGGEVCCVAAHGLSSVCRDVCQFDTLRVIGNFFCHVIRFFT